MKLHTRDRFTLLFCICYDWSKRWFGFGITKRSIYRKQLMLKNKLMRSIHHFQRKSQDSANDKNRGKFHSVSNTKQDTLTFTKWHYTAPIFISHAFPRIRTDQIKSCITLESYGVRKSRIFAFRGAVRGWR